MSWISVAEQGFGEVDSAICIRFTLCSDGQQASQGQDHFKMLWMAPPVTQCESLQSGRTKEIKTLTIMVEPTTSYVSANRAGVNGPGSLLKGKANPETPLQTEFPQNMCARRNLW